MARIDRLNYRDIDVIKALLCWASFYEGVEEARDLTPGVKRILAFLSSLFSPLRFLRTIPRQGSSVTSPRSSSNALLISYYLAGATSLR